MTSTEEEKGWVWAVGEHDGFWSGPGALWTLKVIERMTSKQPGMLAVHRPGEALEVVERIKQRAWGQLYLHLSRRGKALPGLWAPASLGSTLHGWGVGCRVR